MYSLSIIRFGAVTLLTVEHHFTRKAVHSLSGACVILTFSVRIETVAIVFKLIVYLIVLLLMV